MNEVTIASRMSGESAYLRIQGWLAGQAEVRRYEDQVDDVDLSVMVDVCGRIPVWRGRCGTEGSSHDREVYNIDFAITVDIAF